jgi:hypothetical protein
MGSEAALRLAAMEACRNEALQRLTTLDAQRPKIALDFVTTNSASALRKWRELDEEAEQIIERARLFDAAIYHARELAARPDGWRTQWRKIVGTELSTGANK